MIRSFEFQWLCANPCMKLLLLLWFPVVPLPFLNQVMSWFSVTLVLCIPITSNSNPPHLHVLILHLRDWHPIIQRFSVISLLEPPAYRAVWWTHGGYCAVQCTCCIPHNRHYSCLVPLYIALLLFPHSITLNPPIPNCPAKDIPSHILTEGCVSALGCLDFAFTKLGDANCRAYKRTAKGHKRIQAGQWRFAYQNPFAYAESKTPY